jgi:hypothetical protein
MPHMMAKFKCGSKLLKKCISLLEYALKNKYILSNESLEGVKCVVQENKLPKDSDFSTGVFRRVFKCK